MSLILAAAVAGQVYEADFYLIKATEDFVIDSLPKPVRYSQYLPKELAEQVDVWREDCWRCRRTANRSVLAMGPGVIRWLFWTIRAKDLRTSFHSEAMIVALSRCRYCRGTGECPGWRPMNEFPKTCVHCGFYEVAHQYELPRCCHCYGGRFEVETSRRYAGYEVKDEH